MDNRRQHPAAATEARLSLERKVEYVCLCVDHTRLCGKGLANRDREHAGRTRRLRACPGDRFARNSPWGVPSAADVDLSDVEIQYEGDQHGDRRAIEAAGHEPPVPSGLDRFFVETRGIQ